jgi:poly(hydroxyalkanoate) depolymerase family esterase
VQQALRILDQSGATPVCRPAAAWPVLADTAAQAFPSHRQPRRPHRRSRKLPSWADARAETADLVRRLCYEAKADAPRTGRFIESELTNAAGTRSYKLYIPSCYHGQALPLVVMLHGCRQDPDDFAAGTRMNQVAEERRCLVLYPAQSNTANSPRCWSWFNAAHQQRDRGEPSIIADITRKVIRDYGIDKRMVYIGGLSAGGAMAVIMARTYPELFAAAAVHSGLPYNAAVGVFAALTAMRHGPRKRHWLSAAHAGMTPGAMEMPAVPTIVFHGDADTVVHPDNGEHVILQAVSAHGEDSDAAAATVIREEMPEGRSYTRTVYQDENGQNVAEQWLIHGAGHAWSGGCSDGSYTDPHGPDATGEMMRFFYERRLASCDVGEP